MKKIIAFIMAVMVFVGCSNDDNKNANANSKQIIKLGLSADYPPFEFVDNQNKITGFDVELFEAIGKKVGFEIQIQNISFDGLIPALKAGKIDAIMSAMSATEERKKSVDFSDPYYTTENLFIRKKGSSVSSDDIEGRSIGVQLGTVQEIAANKIKGAKVVPSDSPLTAIMGLKAGKVDLVMVDSSIGYGYLKQNNDIEEFLKLSDGSEGFSIAFDKGKYSDLISKVNIALKEMKSDGTFDKLLEKYDLK